MFWIRSQRCLMLLLCAATVPLQTVAQDRPGGTGSDTGKRIAVTDVLTMLEVKLPDSVIVARIKGSQKPSDVSTEDLLRLRNAGASEAVMLALMTPLKANGVVEPTVDAKMEPGIYANKAGAWVQLEPEIVSIKQGSGFRMYTGGVDTKGYIAGASSKTTLKTPLEIKLVATEGVSAAEFQLVRLTPSNKNNTREFRVGRFGFGGGKSGVDRDKVAFEFKKSGPGQFAISLPSSVVAGEYAFLPPSTAGGGSFGGPIASAGKAFTFRVLE